MTGWPRMVLVEQPVREDSLPEIDVAPAITAGFAELPEGTVPAGGTVAIAVGSRGIDKLELIVRQVIAEVRRAGADPFVFPAMGSHGGATAAGQLDVLKSLGITEASIGCPIRSSMETVSLGRTAEGINVYFDAQAAAADATVVVNRIKPHTHFRGDTESGLIKMLAIGTGKHTQAITIHSYGVAGLRDHIPPVARQVIERAPVIAGVAICEDGRHRVSSIEVIPGARISDEEPRILTRARELMARLPTSFLDLLIVDRIGKDVSGTGMDTNVVGRVRALDLQAFEEPEIRVIYARALTEATAGNAIGMGLADIVHRRLVDAVDFDKTYVNAMTGGSPQQGAIPITAETDAAALDFYRSYLAGPDDLAIARIAWIRDSLSLHRMLLSERLADELVAASAVTAVRPPEEFRFLAGDLEDPRW